MAAKKEPTLEEYKAKVREAAIRVAVENGLCRDGLNKELKALGLDPVEPTYNTDWNVTLKVTGGTVTQAKTAMAKAIKALDGMLVEGVVIEAENCTAADIYIWGED